MPTTISGEIEGKPVSISNPLPMNTVTKVSQNISFAYTYDGDNNIIYIDKTIDGVTYRQTLTYVASKLTATSTWVKQ